MMRYLVTALLLGGCGEPRTEQLEAENQELRSHVADLESQLSAARSAAEEVTTKTKALRDSSDELQSQLARFQNEDWRDVVPSASSAGEELETAQTELESASSDLDDATE